MKKLFSFLFIGFFSLAMLTACNKAKSDNNGLLALLGLGGGESPVAGSFVKEFYGKGGLGATSVLFDRTTSEGRCMILNLASDIQGAGVISSISFKREANIAEVTCAGVTIKMGHSNKSTLNLTYLNNVETAGGSKGSFVQVFSGTVTIPAGGSGTYFTISLDTPFYYNGVDNLVMEIVRTAAATDNVGIIAPQHSSGGIFLVYRTGAGSSTNTDADTWSSMFPHTRFNFAGGNNELAYGTESNGMPFSEDTTDPNRMQVLYKASEINGSGDITGIAVCPASDTTAQEHTITVRMGHNSSGVLTASSWNANFDSGSPVAVAKGAVFKIPAGVPAGTYLWLPLAKAFQYNGTDNLVVDIYVASSTGDLSLRSDSIGASTRVYGNSSSPTGGPDNTVYNIKFRFRGGTVDFFPASTTTTTEDSPFTDEIPGMQVLTMYRSCELGTSGTITGMSLRLAGNAVDASYPGLSIVIGQTDDTVFSTSNTFLDSMDGETTVYSGDYAIISGSGNLAGDWVYIPFSTPFAVDPSKNLVIYYKTISGTAINPTVLSNDMDVYGGMFAFSDDTTSTSPGTVSSDIHAIRFTME